MHCLLRVPERLALAPSVLQHTAPSLLKPSLCTDMWKENVFLVINNVGTSQSGGSSRCTIVLDSVISWLSEAAQSYDLNYDGPDTITKPELRHSTSGTKMFLAALECKKE